MLTAFLRLEYDPKIPIGRVLELQNGLYAAGARNFLLINLPPIQRCPGSKNLYGTSLEAIT